VWQTKEIRGKNMSKTIKRTINGTTSLSELIGDLRALFKVQKFFTVTINTGKKRSLDQNAILHVWINQVCKEEREFTEMELKCLWKYTFFMPILRGEDEHFNEVCSKVIDVLPYESRVAAMEYMPVTSLMTTEQLSRGLEAAQKYYIGRVELTFPDEG
jgi:hypothetical protein